METHHLSPKMDADISNEGGRTARWWVCLGLPSDSGERARLRKEYADKLRTHRQGAQDDPLSETKLDEAAAPVRRDIASGLGFPPGHSFGIFPAAEFGSDDVFAGSIV